MAIEAGLGDLPLFPFSSPSASWSNDPVSFLQSLCHTVVVQGVSAILAFPQSRGEMLELDFVSAALRIPVVSIVLGEFPRRSPVKRLGLGRRGCSAVPASRGALRGRGAGAVRSGERAPVSGLPEPFCPRPAPSPPSSVLSLCGGARASSSRTGDGDSAVRAKLRARRGLPRGVAGLRLDSGSCGAARAV